MSLGFPLFPEQASTIASSVDALYLFLVSMTAVMSLLIAVVILIFSTRFRRRHRDEIGTGPHGSLVLEIIWSVIPLGVVLAIFFAGATVFFEMKRTPDDAIEYWAIGKQWMWKFQHPKGNREINDLHVPVGQTIKMTMTSQDVIHSFFVPAFRVKQDVLPGRYTTVWFKATKPGKYHLFCTEYCGAEHSRMIGNVYVMQPNEYTQWLAGGKPSQEPAAAGEELFQAMACNTCHKTSDQGRGPTLHGLYGTDVRLTTGQVATANDTYLRESILNPAAKLVEGYEPIMPSYQGQLSEEGVMHLISYLKTLAPDERSAVGTVETAIPAPAETEAEPASGSVQEET